MDIEPKYAITNRTTNLHLSSELALKDESMCLNAGMLLQIRQIKQSSKRNESKIAVVQLVDFSANNPLCNNLYECPLTMLQTVNELTWLYLISISDPERRLLFAKTQSSHTWVLYPNKNDLVNVLGEPFGNPKTRYTCIIRYIGNVPELHPAGYFLGLELLNLKNGYSPQTGISAFANKYVNCNPNLVIITTIDCLEKINNDANKKPSPFDYINNRFEKVINVISPNSCVNNSSIGRISKKSKKASSSSHFYDTIDSTNSNSNSLEIITNSSDSISTTAPITNMKKSVKIKDGSILKNRANAGRDGGVSPSTDGLKKNNYSTFNVNGRSLHIIDKVDIEEASKNEASVRIIDKTGDLLELSDMLGQNWPADAGSIAEPLNNGKLKDEITARNIPVILAKKSSDRIKSANPITHMGQTQRTSTATATATSAAATNDMKSYNNENASKMANTADMHEDENLLTVDEFDEIPNNPDKLGRGSMVVINLPTIKESLSGVIRWIGTPFGVSGVLVGIEFIEEQQHDQIIDITNGTYNGHRFFECPDGHGLFVPAEFCSIDTRFAETEGAVGNYKAQNGYNLQHCDSSMFGQIDCPAVRGAVPPIKITTLEELEKCCGNNKGIQGHNNSCYLDATLFSMFTFTTVFDSLLYRPQESEDIQYYSEVQKVLREEIVNPLRKNVYVRADRVMKLRRLLDKLSSVSGLTSEEKDPEEFLNSLLTQIMRVEPFLKLNSGQNGYFYQLFVEKDERLSFPTVQELFEQSFYASDIKLKEVPSNLIIQMPRFGKDYKMYPRIVPSIELDITDIIEDSPRQCSSCGKLANVECRDCFHNFQANLEGTSFCQGCFKTIHSHAKRVNHKSKILKVPDDFLKRAHELTVPRLKMELFAVVCIETSHYVTFVKAGLGAEAPWCFFDSMADRKDGINGYNIPNLKTIPDLPFWLSADGVKAINESTPNDKSLPQYAKRLFCDAYMCFYQSPDVMMYR